MQARKGEFDKSQELETTLIQLALAAVPIDLIINAILEILVRSLRDIPNSVK